MPPPAVLLTRLEESDLLDSPQLEELRSLPEAAASDPKPLARAVLQRGWATVYQLNEVAKGRGKALHVGPYLLLELLGEGAMGQVFKARHKTMNRLAAVKVIRAERLKTPLAVRRFYQEVEAAGKLRHPHLVLAYDAGPAENTHFLAMEYVPGVTLRAHVKAQGPLPFPLACEYIRQTALGLQHAHDQGIIHRDIKPANLMLLPEEGLVKILDVGLARLGDQDSALDVTQENTILGTPEYMSPEQAKDPRLVTPSSDLYSLGATLYSLLCGQPPFRGDSLADLHAQLLTSKPTPLAKRGITIPATLQAVLDQMLSKRPEDRWKTAQAVAAALAPFCQVANRMVNLPTARGIDDDWAEPDARSQERKAPQAGRVPPPAKEKAPGKRPVPVGLFVALGIGANLLLVVGGIVAYLLLRTDSQPTQASTPPDLPTVAALPKSEPPGPLASPLPVPSTPTDALLLGESQVLARNLGPVQALAVSADSRWVAAAFGTYLRIWDIDGIQTPKTFSGHQGLITGLAFSPQGQTILSCSEDRSVRLWNVDQGAQMGLLQGHEVPARTAVFLPDGRHGLTGSGPGRPRGASEASSTALGYEAILWDLREHQERLRLGPHSKPLVTVLLAQDGRRALTISEDAFVRFWDLPDGRPRGTVALDPTGPIHAADLSPDGLTLIASVASTIRRFTVEGEAVRDGTVVGSTPTPASCCGFSPDSRLAVSGHGQAAPAQSSARPSDCVVRLWDVGRNKELARLEGHEDPLRAVAFVPDGSRVVSAGVDGTIRLWDVSRFTGVSPRKPAPPPPPPAPEVAAFQGHRGLVHALCFSADGQQLLTGGQDRTMRLWDVLTGKQIKEIGTHKNPLLNVSLVGGKKAFATTEEDQGTLWDLDGASTPVPFPLGTRTALALSPDGSMVACASRDLVHIHRLGGLGEKVQALKGPWGLPRALAFSGDKSRLAIILGDGSILVVDLVKERPVRLFPALKASPKTLALSPKGATLVVAYDDRQTLLFSVGDGKRFPVLGPTREEVHCLAYSPDSKRVATGSSEGLVKLYDVATSRETTLLTRHQTPVKALLFSPDGKRLASAADTLAVATVPQ